MTFFPRPQTMVGKMRKNGRIIGLLALILAVFLAPAVRADELNFIKEFMKAYNTNIGMREVIERHKDLVPAEVAKLLKESHDPAISPGARAQKQYMAETMARVYENVTGDATYLIKVKKDIFDSRLHAPVRSVPVKGIHTITMPRATATEKNLFKPDNIIIRAGEWVRWVNDAGEAHIFASMPLIGKEIIFTPSIKPDETWIQRFTEPGEYYYFCYIHISMVGKITVLPAEKTTAGAKGNGPAIEKTGKSGG
jgi:plastocyanin